MNAEGILERPEVIDHVDLEEIEKAAKDQGLIPENVSLTGDDMDTVIPVVDHGTHWQNGCEHTHTEIV